jgi:signal transduction histidine kinase
MSERERQPRNLPPRDAGAVGVRGPFADSYELTRGLVETVNHHVRTPLTVISGHVELWMDQKDEFPAEMGESLARVLQAGRRLTDVGLGICDLIGAACVDPAAVDRLDVSRLVAEKVAGFRDRATQRGIRVLVEGDSKATCVADAGRFRRALRELLDNAVTYAPEQSTVRVEASVAGSLVRVTVSDEGDGIDAADRERLVRPFERGTHPRQPIARPGMGLAVASAVAGSHAGRLVLSDGVNGGLRASLELPVDFTQWTHGAAAWSAAESRGPLSA